jgi:hypothetical protein
MTGDREKGDRRMISRSGLALLPCLTDFADGRRGA